MFLTSPAPWGWESRGWVEGSHRGIDYGWYNANIAGSRRVVAAAPGRVVEVYSLGGFNQGWGNRVVIEHNPRSKTTYSHGATGTLVVKVGDMVARGQLLHTMGQTGTANGIHSHFELYVDNVRLNPQTFFTQNIPGTPVTSTVEPWQRIVGLKGVVGRDAPTTQGSNIVQEFPDAGTVASFKGRVRGEDVWGDGNVWWFVGKFAGNFFHSSRFTDPGHTGLPDLTPVPPVTPPVTPPVVPTPPTPVKAPSVTVKEFASVTDVRALGSTNYEIGNFPAKPLKVVIHQFGTPGVDTYGSVMNTITQARPSGSESGPHFVIDDTRTTQTASVKNRAYHAGRGGNDFIGIESDPRQSPATIARVRVLLDELEAFYGYRLEAITHRSIPGTATACGSFIDLVNYAKTVTPPVVVVPPTPVPVPPAVVVPPAPEPVVVVPPTPVPPVVSDEAIPGWFVRFITGLIEFFTKFLTKP